MAANGKYVQVGDVLDYTATSAVARGDPFGGRCTTVGIALDDIAANAQACGDPRRLLVTKASGEYSQGAKLYLEQQWDFTTSQPRATIRWLRLERRRFG